MLDKSKIKDIRVLVVDDEEYIRLSLRELLAYLGYQVVTATNGEDALKKLEENRFDVAFVDVKMPEMNGIQLLARIKERFSNVSVIMMTGYATVENAIDAVKLGAYDFLRKPYDIEEVKVSINRLLEKKRLEEERRMAEEKLQNTLAELEKKTEELEAANTELESFSYSVSHDLRAPLRAIIGFSKILIEDYTDKVGDEGRRLLNIIQDNTKKMENLIDDILTLSRIGRKDIILSDVNMYKMAKAVFDEIKALYPKRNIEFQLKLMPPVKGDEGMIHQVFFNLLSNAVKFTKTRDTAIIEIGGHDEGSRNVYYVRDNGVGFNMEYSDRLFNAFQRLHSENEFEGTGIGLATVKRIIDRHKGKIWAEGKEKEGATFYFSLPN
ncbi:MAG: response regulator [Nitrospirae bacterium]|nr:response regulator [Nitrospirota bacterium]